MPRSKPARVSAKVQPKLRMIANGSDEVNALRAEHACAVAVTKAVAEQVAPLRAEGAVPVGKRQLPRRIERGSLSAPPRARVSAFVQLSDEVAGEPPRTLPGETAAKANVRTVEVSVAEALELARDPKVVSVELGQPLKLPDQLVTATSPGAPTAATRKVRGRAHRSGEGVLVGLIDVGGFDFAHPDFLDADGTTRFERIWDQGGATRPPPRQRGTSPFGYGAELRKAELDHAIASAPAGRPPGLRARAAVGDVARLARHACGLDRRRQPRRRAQGAARRRARLDPRRGRRAAALLLRLEPARARRRVPARPRPRAGPAGLDQRQPRHERPRARRLERDQPLDRRGADRAGAQRLRRGRQRGPGAGGARRRRRLRHGPRAREREDPGARARGRSRVERGRQRPARHLRERAGDLVRGARPLRRAGQAARPAVDGGRGARAVRREPPARRRLLPQRLQRALPRRQRRELDLDLPQPAAARARDRRRPRGAVARAAPRAGRARRELPRVDRARRPAPRRPRGGAGGVGLPVVLLRELVRRPLDGEHAGLRAADHLRRELRRAAAADQHHEQPGADARRPPEARHRRAGDGHRRGQRLRPRPRRGWR